MLLLMCMALGTTVFAQGYTYKDADFAATAERIAQNKIVAEFPDGFYSDDENKAESTYGDRRALLQAAQEQYTKNPKSFIATYNYGAALLSEYHFDDSVSLSEQNATKNVCFWAKTAKMRTWTSMSAGTSAGNALNIPIP